LKKWFWHSGMRIGRLPHLWKKPRLRKTGGKGKQRGHKEFGLKAISGKEYPSDLTTFRKLSNLSGD